MKLNNKLIVNAPHIHELKKYQPVEGIVMHNCIFCHHEEQLSKEVIFQTPNFYLLPNFTPIVEGDMMILSKSHYGCAGELDNSIREEFIGLRKLAKNLTYEIYGKVMSYEHGRAGHCVQLQETSIPSHHFHMHILPAVVDIRESLRNLFREINLKCFSEIFHAYERNGNYLYYENNKNEKYFYPKDEKFVESHFLRSLICKELKTAELVDWEKYRDFESQAIAIKKYKALLKGCR